MKLLHSLAANVLAGHDDGKGLHGLVEVVAIVDEAVYAFDPSNRVYSRRELTTLRFFAESKQLREIAKSLVKFADKADEDVAPYNLARASVSSAPSVDQPSKTETPSHEA